MDTPLYRSTYIEVWHEGATSLIRDVATRLDNTISETFSVNNVNNRNNGINPRRKVGPYPRGAFTHFEAVFS